MYNGCCAICGMRMPISQVQAVRLCKQIQNCPSCARILYEESDAPRWVGEAPSRTEPRKSGISRFSAESLMVPDLKATTGAEAIAELAAVMEEKGFVSGVVIAHGGDKRDVVPGLVPGAALGRQLLWGS